ncbi:hypothetical protein RR48_00583 [Papilio machaon]|uniref:Uncharacterized protein n=1 Tax=Papilio machaon TaxID=76193 RepID=A0A0N0PC34_PAPMA|nr:hypothetical protein RR48_00583 [Papilio machaon]
MLGITGCKEELNGVLVKEELVNGCCVLSGVVLKGEGVVDGGVGTVGGTVDGVPKGLVEGCVPKGEGVGVVG